MRFLTFTTRLGTPVLVNPNHIVSVHRKSAERNGFALNLYTTNDEGSIVCAPIDENGQALSHEAVISDVNKWGTDVLLERFASYCRR